MTPHPHRPLRPHGSAEEPDNHRFPTHGRVGSLVAVRHGHGPQCAPLQRDWLAVYADRVLAPVRGRHTRWSGGPVRAARCRALGVPVLHRLRAVMSPVVVVAWSMIMEIAQLMAASVFKLALSGVSQLRRRPKFHHIITKIN